MSEQPRKQMSIHVPDDLRAVYWNMATVHDDGLNFVVDFLLTMAGSPIVVQARLCAHPVNARALGDALLEHVKKYEDIHGALSARSGDLSTQLFVPPGVR